MRCTQKGAELWSVGTFLLDPAIQILEMDRSNAAFLPVLQSSRERKNQMEFRDVSSTDPDPKG